MFWGDNLLVWKLLETVRFWLIRDSLKLKRTATAGLRHWMCMRFLIEERGIKEVSPRHELLAKFSRFTHGGEGNQLQAELGASRPDGAVSATFPAL